MTDPEEDMVASAEQFRALAHPVRHRLLFALSQRPATLSGLAAELDISKGSAGHHLKILREAGLVAIDGTRQVRGGTERYFRRTFKRLRYEDAASRRAAFAAMAEDVLSDESDPLLTLRNVRLGAEQARRLRAALEELVEDLSDEEGGERYGVLVGLYRPGASPDSKLNPVVPLARVVCDRGMDIELGQPSTEGWDEPLAALREWQVDGAPMHLHPGDIGWYWRVGPKEVAAAVRFWRRDGRVVAVGLLDGADLLRVTSAPEVRGDVDVARRIAEDLVDPARGVLPEGRVAVEAPSDWALQEVLPEYGWKPDEPWTPLFRDLAEPVEDSGLRIAVVGEDLVPVRTAVHRSAFGGPHFVEDRWRDMAAGPLYADAKCLVGFDGEDAVAAVTVWSAGSGRPGLIEPMGVHADHRGRGYGRAMNLAAAAALREMGASSLVVCTPSDNVGAVATYASAGFVPQPEVRDLFREA